MAIQRKIQVLMNDIEHRDLKRGKGRKHMSILFYAHWVSRELYRKELAQVFTLSKGYTGFGPTLGSASCGPLFQ
jgi:hypothetical protein